MILQPVGSLFFAGAAALESNLPDVDRSSHSVVVLRLREYDEIGSTLVRALTRYATRLQARQGRLYLAGVEPHVVDQLRNTQLIQMLGEDAVFPVTAKRGESVRKAAAAAREWVGRQGAPATGADGDSFDPAI